MNICLPFRFKMPKVFVFVYLCIILLVLIGQKVVNSDSGDELVVKMYKIVYDDINYDYIARNFTGKLKAINRHKSAVFLDGWLIKPLKNVSIHGQLFKYFSQFRPYLFNIKLNYCNLMSGNIQKNYIVQLFLSRFENSSNVLHTCPFNGHIYAHDLWLDGSHVKLPFPLGRYQLKVVFFEGISNTLATLGHISYYADIFTKK